MLNAIKNVKKKAWITIGVSFLLVVACAGVVYVDYESIGEEEQKIGGLETQNAQADARIAKIRSHEDRVLKERLVVKEYVKILPDDKDINNFVDRITEFASSSGVEIESLDDRAARNRNSRKSRDAFLKINYIVELTGTTNQFLNFIHRFETYDRFVSVKAVHVRAKQSSLVDEGLEEQRHKVTLELETYVYQPGNRARPPVEIVNSEKRMVEIAETTPLTGGLKLESYEFVSKPTRRDPFADAREVEPSDELKEKKARDIEAQIAYLEEMAEELENIRQGVAKEAEITEFVAKIEFMRRLNEHMVRFDQRIKETAEQKVFTRRDLRERFDEEVAQPFGRIFSARAHIDPVEFRQQELEAELQRMTAAFEEDRYADVVAAAKTLVDTRPGRITDDKLRELFAKIESLAMRAQARMEFAELRLAITGYVYQPSDPEKAVVIINDRAYSPGDVLDDGVVVGKVDQANVVFVYKQEKIGRPLE